MNIMALLGTAQGSAAAVHFAVEDVKRARKVYGFTKIKSSGRVRSNQLGQGIQTLE
jgi:hypothetical protein